MATKNIVPRANDEGQVGTTSKKWNKIYATDLDINQTGSFGNIEVDFIKSITGSDLNINQTGSFGRVNSDFIYSTGKCGIGTDDIEGAVLAVDLTSNLDVSQRIISIGDISTNERCNISYFAALAGNNASFVGFSGKGNTSNQLVLMGSGDVGIGTTNPTTKLDVRGGGYVSGSLEVISTLSASEVYVSGNVELYGGGNTKLRINGDPGSGNTSGSLILKGRSDASAGVYGEIFFNGYDDNIGTPNINSAIRSVRGSNDCTDLWFYTSLSEAMSVRMVLDQNGYVGIGMTAPTHKLAVNGTISGSLVLSTRSYLHFGYDAAIEVNLTTTTTTLKTIDGAENGQGYRMIRNGQVTGVSCELDVTNASPNAVASILVYKNSVEQFESETFALSSTGNRGMFDVTGTTFSFVAGNQIKAAIKVVESDDDIVNVSNIAVLVEILT